MKRAQSRFAIDRRTLLRGIAGGTAVAVALPTLEAMLNGNGTALAQGEALPRRLGIFFWGNGVRLAQWTPQDTGAAWTPSPELEPLASVKDYINVVSGMDIKTGNERGHHAGCVGILSGAPMIPQPAPNSNYVSTFSAPSIDQVAAAQIGQTTRFRSLEIGISRRVVKGEGTTLWYLSHNGPDNTNPPEYEPRALYDRIFGTGFTAPSAMPVVDHTVALRRSVLDAVRQDIGDLKKRVGALDTQRLDQHFENIRALENRLELMGTTGPVGASCALPSAPAEIDDENNREDITARMTAMSELVAMSLACDLTRVFSVMFSGSVGGTVFWQVDVDTGHHQLTHDEPGDQPQVHATTVYTMEQFAILLSALKALPEGDGNLLDHSAILASSDVSEGLPHSIDDYPILVAGGGGGYLKTPGVHYRSPDGENTSQVLLSVLRAAGAELDEFGVEGGQVTQSCSAIEA
jgi:hypothetical protein